MLIKSHNGDKGISNYNVLEKIMKLSIKWALTLSCFFVFSQTSFAVSTHLVLDAENNETLPRVFRMTNKIPHLHMMGSAQFSAKNFDSLMKQPIKPSYIFDLRQESHGFLNGMAISWYGKNNWANLKKTPDQINIIETQLLHRLSRQNTEIIYKIKPNKEATEIHPNTVNNEKTIADHYKINYIRIPVPDHRRPNDHQVDQFISIYKHIPTNEWVYFHCRGGKGRTTTFMSMMDMLQNAKTLSFNQIITRQNTVGGINLTKINPNKKNKQYAVERLQFLKQFYLYSKNNTDHYQTSWQSWLQQQNNQQ